MPEFRAKTSCTFSRQSVPVERGDAEWDRAYVVERHRAHVVALLADGPALVGPLGRALEHDVPQRSRVKQDAHVGELVELAQLVLREDWGREAGLAAYELVRGPDLRRSTTSVDLLSEGSKGAAHELLVLCGAQVEVGADAGAGHALLGGGSTTHGALSLAVPRVGEPFHVRARDFKRVRRERERDDAAAGCAGVGADEDFSSPFTSTHSLELTGSAACELLPTGSPPPAAPDPLFASFPRASPPLFSARICHASQLLPQECMPRSQC